MFRKKLYSFYFIDLRSFLLIFYYDISLKYLIVNEWNIRSDLNFNKESEFNFLNTILSACVRLSRKMLSVSELEIPDHTLLINVIIVISPGHEKNSRYTDFWCIQIRLSIQIEYSAFRNKLCFSKTFMYLKVC